MQLTDLLKSSALYSLSKSVGSLAMVILVPLVILWIGPENYSIYATWYSVTVSIATLSMGWMYHSLLYFYASYNRDNPGLIEEYLFFVLKFLGLLTLLLVPCLLLYSYFYTSDLLFLSSCLVLGFAIISHGLLQKYYQARLEPGNIIYIEILRVLSLYTAVSILVFLLFSSAIAMIWSLILAYGISAIWGYNRILNEIQKSLSRIRFSNLFPFFKYGWPLSLWAGFFTLFPAYERIILQEYLISDYAGEYMATYDIFFKGMSFLLLPVTLAVHPQIMTYHHAKKYADLWKTIWKSLFLQVLISTTILAGFYFQGNFLLQTLFPEFSHITLNHAMLLAIAAAIWQLTLIIHKPLEKDEKTKMMLVFLAISLITYIIMLPFSLNINPDYGAPLTLVLCALIYFTLCFTYMIKTWIRFKRTPKSV